MITKPAELVKAEAIEAIAVRYHSRPDEVLRADASLLRHVEILARGQRRAQSATARGAWEDEED